MDGELVFVPVLSLYPLNISWNVFFCSLVSVFLCSFMQGKKGVEVLTNVHMSEGKWSSICGPALSLRSACARLAPCVHYIIMRGVAYSKNPTMQREAPRPLTSQIIILTLCLRLIRDVSVTN